MIRFPCPSCNQTLKVPDEKAGRKVSCPRCKERTTVPGPDGELPPPAPKAASGKASNAAVDLSQESSLFEKPTKPEGWRGMPRWLRWTLGSVASAGMLAVALGLLAPSLAAEETAASIRHVCVPVTIVAILGSLVMIHGYGTSCPSCGRWWAAEKQGVEEVGSEEFTRDGGILFKRLIMQTNFRCKSCQHTWGTRYTDEYRKPASKKKQPK